MCTRKSVYSHATSTYGRCSGLRTISIWVDIPNFNPSQIACSHGHALVFAKRYYADSPHFSLARSHTHTLLTLAGRQKAGRHTLAELVTNLAGSDGRIQEELAICTLLFKAHNLRNFVDEVDVYLPLEGDNSCISCQHLEACREHAISAALLKCPHSQPLREGELAVT